METFKQVEYYFDSFEQYEQEVHRLKVHGVYVASKLEVCGKTIIGTFVLTNGTW